MKKVAAKLGDLILSLWVIAFVVAVAAGVLGVIVWLAASAWRAAF